MEEGEQQNNGDNAPYLTISELSRAVKTAVETAFEFVRVRAEVSRPNKAPSGHLYFTLKDDRSTLAAVCWKTMRANLAVQPEEGLEVIVTGRLTTFAGQSKYQIVVSQIEVAGEGALLKQLEDRRRMLAGEGLFDTDRKKKIPKMPAVIGVVTSPTGAVIQDILHRLHDRFGVHVLVWGTPVQGRDAAGLVAAAIRGFDMMPDDWPVPRPDVLIVARGGGALEDLWTFNEEIVVRAVAECRIPVISAIGHETDTTLIDHAADLRAPTPTAAAELAVPVKTDLAAYLGEVDARLLRSCALKMESSGQKIAIAAGGLVDPIDMIQRRAQTLDYALGGLFQGLDLSLSVRSVRLSGLAGRLNPPETKIVKAEGHLLQLVQRFDQQLATGLNQRQQKLDNLEKLLDSNSFERVLDRGFALVTNNHGVPIKRAAAAPADAAVTIRFADGGRGAVLGTYAADVTSTEKPKPRPKKPREQAFDGDQDRLF
ncbi:exodeoxyribonuclease VII large subunit [Candidatus Puniceispirillum sp.]|nr:exodeoxyribonuclease VII large subunit [Candidatus Puniceispirillum sp.]